MKADKMTMAASLESRMPFLDVRLIEWANRRLNKVKVRRVGLGKYETKSVLRRFCNGRLPKAIITRPKKGFSIPTREWLRNELKTWAEDLLFSGSSKLSSSFDLERLKETYLDAQHSDAAVARIWNVLILELWMQQWNATLA